jgi:F-type H+-transporting ATPase subunit alpha
MKIKPEEISEILQSKIKSLDFDTKVQEIGKVIQLADGIANVYGLKNVTFGEVLEFESGEKGIALSLYEESVSVVFFENTNKVKEGDLVKRTKKLLSIKVGESLIGRVLDTLANPIDGKGEIKGELFDMPIERNAPGIIFRQPVNIPLQTGIKAIDTMIPIGRGQRELIIGDRQTGKTTIAIDTIINQRSFFEEGNPVYCIYVSIGQKSSTVAHIVNELEKHKAMEYTVVISAPASKSPSMQFYAPFTGAAIGEYFRDTGRHALVIFDDLSKQSVAYREVCLLLRRPPGREAFPGDVFYLHSRLLERAAMINKNDSIAKNMNDLPDSIKSLVKGGGSLTALPIVETQAGDVSAYIPTNVISITDGQIFLESKLFNSGIRPAVNVGISVSRVGSAAQIKSMKKVAGKLRLNQAQFRELEAFAKFGSDLDSSTKFLIERGKKNQEILKQNQYEPMHVSKQVIIIYLSINGFLDKVDIKKIKSFETDFLNMIEAKNKNILKEISNGNFDEKITSIIENECKSIVDSYI